jgi:hypothetical protein
MAPSGAIYLGETVANNAHAMWRSRMRAVDLPTDWSYKNAMNGEPYKVYELAFDA